MQKRIVAVFLFLLLMAGVALSETEYSGATPDGYGYTLWEIPWGTPPIEVQALVEEKTGLHFPINENGNQLYLGSIENLFVIGMSVDWMEIFFNNEQMSSIKMADVRLAPETPIESAISLLEEVYAPLSAAYGIPTDMEYQTAHEGLDALADNQDVQRALVEPPFYDAPAMARFSIPRLEDGSPDFEWLQHCYRWDINGSQVILTFGNVTCTLITASNMYETPGSMITLQWQDYQEMIIVWEEYQAMRQEFFRRLVYDNLTAPASTLAPYPTPAPMETHLGL